MKGISLIATVLIAASATSSPAAVTLIDGATNNGGFEAETGTSVTAWTLVGGSNQESHAAIWAANSGNNGMWHQSWAPDLNRSIHQEFSASAGDTFTVSSWNKVEDGAFTNGNVYTANLIFFDGGASEISRQTVDIMATRTNAGFEERTMADVIAPAGTVTVRLSYEWTTPATLGTTSQVSMFVDDVTLTVDPIPEPSFFALLGLAGLVCLRRRRRE